MTAQHILVPTDFSEYANYALDYAIGLAQPLQARLTILHVMDTTSLEVAESATPRPPVDGQELEACVEQGLATSLKRARDAGLEGETIVVHGDPLQMIIDAAESAQVDLIVMGTRGRTGLAHVLMGSVAERVVRMAPCPVLVARSASSATDA